MKIGFDGRLFFFLLNFIFLPLFAQEESTRSSLKEAFLIKRPEFIHYRQLLITYKGCIQSKSERSKEEAIQLMKEIIDKYNKGTKIGLLCFQYSEHSSKFNLGVMPFFNLGEQLPQIENILLQSKIGPLIPAVVETPFGLHLLQRLPLQKLYFSHIIIRHQNSFPKASRTQEEARELAKKILMDIHSKKATFEELAARHSEGPISRARRGYIGEGAIGFLPPQIEWVLHRLPPEGVATDLVETSLGVHILKRHKVGHVRIRHLLFSHNQALNLLGKPKINREQAFKLATEARNKLLKGVLFDELAKENPDETGRKGGDLGYFMRGEDFFFGFSIFDMKVGDYSPPIDSPFGVHIVQRME